MCNLLTGEGKGTKDLGLAIADALPSIIQTGILIS